VVARIRMFRAAVVRDVDQHPRVTTTAQMYVLHPTD
jgi:hypothetical protein